MAEGNATICPDGGFDGKLSNFVFFNTAITSAKAREIYSAGPVYSENLLSQVPSWVYYGIVLIVLLVIAYTAVA